MLSMVSKWFWILMEEDEGIDEAGSLRTEM